METICQPELSKMRKAIVDKKREAQVAFVAKPPYWISMSLAKHAASSGYSAWNCLKVYLAIGAIPYLGV
jgi:hypothetical protein